MTAGERKLRSEGRARLLNVALPVLTEIFAELRAVGLGAMTGSFRLGESASQRDIHAAKLCAIEELESKINEYILGGKRDE